jgi:hypothetical protein
MTRINSHPLATAAIGILFWGAAAFSAGTTEGAGNSTEPFPGNRVLMARLVKAYPEHLKGFEGNEIIWIDGTRMPFDDGDHDKPFEKLLNSPSLRDQFIQAYPLGGLRSPPELNFDPGRIRYEPFFAKMYGDCEKPGFKRNLVAVRWMPHRDGQTLSVTKVNGINKRLEAISTELQAFPEEYVKYVLPASGVLSCRTIAGTARKSMHAYAAAIDINTRHSHYWLWSQKKSRTYKYENAVPYEIARIFEKHGFIWGAKWYHFDTMHFEYRPELFDEAAPAN